VKTNLTRSAFLTVATKCVLAVVLLTVCISIVSAQTQTNKLEPTGNAGVGTTTPESILTVQTTGTDSGGDKYLRIKNTSSFTGLMLDPNQSGDAKWLLLGGYPNVGDFTIREYNVGNYFTIKKTTGNVGVGTTNPWQRFTVVGTAGNREGVSIAGEGNSWIYTDLNLTPISSTIPAGKPLNFAWSVRKDAYYGGDSSGPSLVMEIGRQADSSPYVPFIINPSGNVILAGASNATNGNVGIGTVSPGAKLHVSAGDSSYALFGPNTTWGGSLAVGSGLSLVTPISARAQVLSSNGNLHLDAGTGQNVYIGWLTPTNTFINAQGGSVGINTTTPNSAYKLDVNGEINATGLRINGTPISGGGSSPWSGTSGNPIYYTGGNVGVGTNNPSHKLVVGNATTSSINPNFQIIGASTSQSWIGAAVNNKTIYFGSDGTNFKLDAYDYGASAPLNLTLGGNGGDLLFPSSGVWKSTGNVGIGTTTPASNLQIGTQAPGASASPTTLSLGGSYSSVAGSNFKLKLYDDGNTANTYGIGVSSGTMDFGVHSSAGYKWYAGGANKMTLTSNGDLSVSGNIAAKYQDVAEWVPSTQQLEPGTVVVLDVTRANEVIASSQSYDTRVAGVVSAQPGITLGEGGEGKALVATTGRVRVKVDASRAPINIGDLLVTSDISGVAMKSEPVEFAGRKMHMPGTIIGKALEPLAKGQAEILVLLSLQ
jgi:hypothetical protein